MPISEDQAFLVARATGYDRDGSRIGPVVGIYSDNHTGRPEWVTLSVEPATGDAPAADEASTDTPAAGPSGERTATGPVRFAPLASASYGRGRLTLDVTLGQVVTAPVTPDGEELDGPAEVRLYAHYGLSPAGDTDVDPATGTTARAQGDAADHSLLPPAER
jgi:hypothetical protein